MGEQKSLLQKLKELLRLPRFTRPAAESESQPDHGETDVTVEREPDTASEDAVKGTSTAEKSETQERGVGSGTAGETTSGKATDDGTPVEEIKGIGPTYAGRLEDAGISTVEALATADAADVAKVAQASETKATNWIERANEF